MPRFEIKVIYFNDIFHDFISEGRLPLRQLHKHIQLLNHYHQRRILNKSSDQDMILREPVISSRIVHRNKIPNYATMIAYEDRRIEFIHEFERIMITMYCSTEKIRLFLESGDEVDISIQQSLHGDAFQMYSRFASSLSCIRM